MGKYWDQVTAISQSTEFSPAGPWHRAKLGQRMTITRSCTYRPASHLPSLGHPLADTLPHLAQRDMDQGEPGSIPRHGICSDGGSPFRVFWRLRHLWPPWCSASSPRLGKDRPSSSKTRRTKPKEEFSLICGNKAHSASLTIHANSSVSNPSPYLIQKIVCCYVDN